MNLTPPPLSLYVHVPWCVQKCPYCDFNSHALKGEIPQAEYIDALLEDLAQDRARYLADDNRPLHSIFIGGGTPSLIAPAQIARLLQGIQAQIPFAEDIEITMEANPGTLESAPILQYRQAGITRLSLGVQSFANDKLNLLGRIHQSDEAKVAIEQALKAGFNSVNVDLMHGLPSQTPAQALSDLDQLIALKPPHVSWYQLTIEPNTLFASKPPVLPDDDDLWDIYELGQKKLEAAGYQRYETSGFSQPGYQCKHNLNYWRFGDYLGIGCGAHGKISHADGAITRTVKVKHPKGYLDSGRDYLSQEIPVPVSERPFEFMMNRLRLIEPCPHRDYSERTGLNDDTIAVQLNQAKALGYIVDVTDSTGVDCWQVTDKGALFLNDLLELFLADEDDVDADSER
ncbi:Heme chaperone HemW [Vibrio stylophorae]|uniref:Heme chaperone HemW n=1 Tax=Vibrio stylophorae TaxID=659351 RepID=A0ABM8ZQN4_9VIBR|nr:radical SAM family heme chaperone HemW [Vibrio stylophorae]CAH0532592.1 Heme chaperone HemW [Vibrio stylophorae]